MSQDFFCFVVYTQYTFTRMKKVHVFALFELPGPLFLSWLAKKRLYIKIYGDK